MSGKLLESLRRGGHLFGLRREDVTQSDVRGTRRQGDINLHIVMGGDAKT